MLTRRDLVLDENPAYFNFMIAKSYQLTVMSISNREATTGPLSLGLSFAGS